ncbi:PD-(D/E)XK nuclease family transposase [Lachnospiraceae bacterium XBB1006]|nr:PD-(D/E)XK nuclease family transposase [Lachnospiraceae bacterium XBB1006]
MKSNAYFFASEQDVYNYFGNYPGKSRTLENMHAHWKQRLLDYMTGKKTLPFTYDPFFKMVFNPDRNPERLSSFLSSILGKEVQVIDILPVEHTLHDGNSLVIMDLLVRLNDGSRANVEIQKYGAAFPSQRMSCYSADSLMQEYEWAKAHTKDATFDYRNVNKVYTIVIYETSPSEYTEAAQYGEYIHHGMVRFPSHLSLDMLQEYFIINLDIFNNTDYTRDRSILCGWLRFLTTENMADVDAVISAHPWLREIYEDVANYMRDPKEVLGMWSKTLQELDKGAVQLYWDQLHEQIKDAEVKYAALNAVLEETSATLQEKKAALQESEAALQEKDIALQEKDVALQEKDVALQEKDVALQEKDVALQERDSEIARLKSELFAYKKNNS